MKCPHCGEETNVLQTFDHDDHVLRVRGHCDRSKCWWRAKTVERYDTYKGDQLIEGAQATILELRQIISQLKDFDVRMKHALGLETLLSVLDTTDDEINLFAPSE